MQNHENTYRQLIMFRSAGPVPEAPLPPGWSVRSMEDDEGAIWAQIATAGGFFKAGEMEPEARWMDAMDSDPGVKKENVFFACDERGKPVAIAAARLLTQEQCSHFPPSEGLGYLHYVATLPESRGKGAGRAVTAAVLRRLNELGLWDCALNTDDFRLPAIKIYLRMGWRPVLYSPDMTERWDGILSTLQYTEPVTAIGSQQQPIRLR